MQRREPNSLVTQERLRLTPSPWGLRRPMRALQACVPNLHWEADNATRTTLPALVAALDLG